MNTFKARLLSIFILGCLLAALPSSYAQAADAIIYVKWDAPKLPHDGSSWAYAYTDLQSALAASHEGTQIWVARGTYTPTTGEDRGLSFKLQDGVALYGGFVGKETSLKERDPQANVTTLSGDIGKLWNRDDNSYHVIMSGKTDSTAILDGFTVAYGNASSVDPDCFGGGMYNLGNPTLTNIIFSSNSALSGGGMYNHGDPRLINVIFNRNFASYDSGGGMYNSSSSPALRNVTFSDNFAGNAGGGMYNSSSSPALRKVMFSNNSATNFGGGMYNYSFSNATLTDVTFSSNSAQQGGGMYNRSSSSPTLTTVRFNKNFASSDGGGMYNSSSSSPTLTNVTFSDNTTTGSGGGMSNSYTTNNPILTDVTFSNNSATNSGGGLNNNGDSVLTNVTFSSNSASNGGGMSNLGSPKLTNVTFSQNSASNYGGGMLNSPAGKPTLTNVTFRGNSASYNGGGIHNDGTPILRNTILWGNTAPDGSQVYDNSCYGATINDSVVQDDCPAGSICTNIITTDPLLGTLGDYGGRTQTIPLGTGSSAIDSGDDANCPATDQRGIARPQGSHCDIGAYEAPPLVAVGPGMYDDTDPAWQYTGNWTLYDGAGPYNNTSHYTNTVGSEAELQFNGTQFTLTYVKAWNRGLIDVYVDGTKIDTINSTSSTVEWQQTWTSPVFAAGVHTVRFVHAGGATYIDLDAIEIIF